MQPFKTFQIPLSQSPPVQTYYIDMLLQLDDIPQLHNVLAGLFTWLFLAGFLFFPGSVTELRSSDAVKKIASQSAAGKAVFDSVLSIPLLGLAIICCVIATLGVVWLWWTWNTNFIWLLRRLFLFINSATGFVNAIVNVYTAQHGIWSTTAKITAAVTGFFALISLTLFLVYNNWFLVYIKERHEVELTRQSNVVGEIGLHR